MKNIVLGIDEDISTEVSRMAMAAAVNSGRSIYVDDSDPRRVIISDYQEALAVVTQGE